MIIGYMIFPDLKEGERFHALVGIFSESIVLGKRIIMLVFFNIFCGNILKGGGGMSRY